MKISHILFIASFSLVTVSCSLNEDAAGAGNNNDEVVVGFEGSFGIVDRIGRPAINTAVINGDRKEAFNTSITSTLEAQFSDEIEAEIMRISPEFNTPTDTNALGLTANALAGLLANDVLNVSLTGTTTFFDGTNVLTGRTLEDDVMDTELLLIFGGSDGTQNPNLTTDFVSNNDKDFLSSFPYLATPW